jgi:hypothetical protein
MRAENGYRRVIEAAGLKLVEIYRAECGNMGLIEGILAGLEESLESK